MLSPLGEEVMQAECKCLDRSPPERLRRVCGPDPSGEGRREAVPSLKMQWLVRLGFGKRFLIFKLNS